MATRIQLRRGTSTEWSAANPILSYGEVGIEIDTKRFRIGDGSTAWDSLPYFQDTETTVDGAPSNLDTLGKIATVVSEFSGGTTGQALVKVSGTDYDVIWTTLSLSGLSDINLSGLSNRDILVYDSATSKWIRRADPRIFVQSTTPTGAVAGDLWIW